MKMTYTNTTGSEVTLEAGRLIGRIYSSGKAWPQGATATDGSEQPVGVCGDTYVVANAATVEITVCIGGDVDPALIKLSGAETLDTVVTRTYTDSGTETTAIPVGRIRDLIARNTQIILSPSTELTKFDN